MGLALNDSVDQRVQEDNRDKILVASYQRGNSNALGELYRRHSGRVESVARSVVGPSSELEDLVQDVFIELQRSLFGFRGDARFTTWLHRITVNVALQYLRRGKRKGFLRWLSLDAVRPARALHNPEGRAEARETVAALYEVLGKLSDKKRIVFTLFELEGLSLEEIAATVGTSTNTVKSRLHHARLEVFEEVRSRGLLPSYALQVIK